MTFLKWAGGKHWLAPSLSGLIENLEGTYFEPFLGGGSMYFAARPQRAVLGDINPDLIHAFRMVRDKPDTLIRRLRAWRFRGSQDYYAIRRKEPGTDAARAARFLYLNRTCWNGLYRVNRAGEFNVPCGRFVYQPDYVGAKRIRSASRALRSAKLMIGDFTKTTASATAGDVIYFDPPYTVAHGHNGFRKYNESIFSWQDQERLAQEVKRLHQLRCSVIVSNAYHSSIRALYRDRRYKIRLIDRESVIAADVNNRSRVPEYLITNFEWGWKVT